MTRPQKKQVLLASVLAVALATLGWIGMKHLPYIDVAWGVEIFLAVIAMPGVVVEAALEAVFSPQGIHDGQAFAWVVYPSNLILYYIVSLFVLRGFRVLSKKA